MYQCANGEFLKLSKDPVIFGEIISGDFLQSAMAAIGMPQLAAGPLKVISSTKLNQFRFYAVFLIWVKSQKSIDQGITEIPLIWQKFAELILSIR